MRLLAPSLVLLLAGCATLTSDPEATARAALDELLGGIAEGSGSLSRLEGTLSGGGYSVPFTLDIARDGTRHVNLSAGPLTMDVYCRGEEVVRMIEGAPYLARGGCPLDGGRFGAPRDALAQLRLVSTGRDGVLLVAAFTASASAEDEGDVAVGNVTVKIDGRGNVRHVAMSAPGESGINATASHEPRRRWTLPETDDRLAAAVEGDADFYDGVYEWEVDDAHDDVSLDEIEVRVDRTSTGEEVARFRPHGGEQNVSGLLFRFVDGDEDGRLSERDSFTIEGDQWTHGGDYTVVVWDTWADAPLAPRRIPFPGLVTLALALALALVLHSRQRG